MSLDVILQNQPSGGYLFFQKVEKILKPGAGVLEALSFGTKTASKTE